MGWGDVGYNGSSIRTPAIDALAAKGVRLDRYYAFPFCSPTRVAVMSGRSPIRFGIVGPIFATGGLPLDERTLGEEFRAAGYQTWFLGKWHLGHETKAYLPNERGWDHAYGSLTGGLDHFSHNSETFRGAPDWHRNGEPLEQGGHSTDLYTMEVRDLIDKRDRERPFLLYVGYNAPHTPLQATEESLAEYAHVEDPYRRRYSAMVSHLDQSVGEIVRLLEAQGLAENTLLVWVSDNGGSLRGGASNGDLRDQKGSVYEGGVRVPGVVYWPGRVNTGVLPQQMSAMDWLPTFAAAAGVSLRGEKPRDGVNMWPALTHGKDVERGDLVLASFRGRAVYRGRWKYVVPSARAGRRGGGARGAGRRGGAARGGGPRGGGAGRGAVVATPQLFDIVADPGETRDLSEDQPALVKELAAIAEGLGELSPARGRGASGGFGLPSADTTYPEDNGPHMLERVAP